MVKFSSYAFPIEGNSFLFQLKLLSQSLHFIIVTTNDI